MPSIDDCYAMLRTFAEERDWTQFHQPRSLLLALIGEVGELSALLQWVPDSELTTWLKSTDRARDVEHEFADVLAYVLYLADALDIDPAECLLRKIELNDRRYPLEASRGNSRKYTELQHSKQEGEAE